MLIRSQNKLCLVNLDNLIDIDSNHLSDDSIVIYAACLGRKNEIRLGVYKDANEASKVIDALQAFWATANTYKELKYVRDHDSVIPVCFVDVPDLVFQMPQEDEACLTD